MSSDYRLLPEKIDELCKQQMRLQLLHIGDWIKFPETIHELYAHLAQFIAANDNRGLKNLSEENLEALHKIARKFRETKARLMNLGDNLHDTLARLNTRSDPVVQYYEPKVVCKICDREGHSQISCDYASSKTGPNLSYEDSVFWLYVDPRDRPEGFD